MRSAITIIGAVVVLSYLLLADGWLEVFVGLALVPPLLLVAGWNVMDLPTLPPVSALPLDRGQPRRRAGASGRGR